MLLKEEIMGIKCKIIEHDETCEDEHIVLVSGKQFCVKKRNVEVIRPVEKFAVIGESPFFIKSSGITEIIGPTKTRHYLVKINSRGYLREFFVPEDDIIFLR